MIPLKAVQVHDIYTEMIPTIPRILGLHGYINPNLSFREKCNDHLNILEALIYQNLLKAFLISDFVNVFSPYFIIMKTERSNRHRIIEWFELEGPLKII